MNHNFPCSPQGRKLSQLNPTCCIGKTILGRQTMHGKSGILASFPGHSQILSHSCGEKKATKSWSGLGTRLLGFTVNNSLTRRAEPKDKSGYYHKLL